MGTPDGTGHARPGLFEGKDALHIGAVNLLTSGGVKNGRLDTKEGERGRAWLGGGGSSEGSNDVGSCFCLPICLSRAVSL